MLLLAITHRLKVQLVRDIYGEPESTSRWKKYSTPIRWPDLFSQDHHCRFWPVIVLADTGLLLVSVSKQRGSLCAFVHVAFNVVLRSVLRTRCGRNLAP